MRWLDYKLGIKLTWILVIWIQQTQTSKIIKYSHDSKQSNSCQDCDSDQIMSKYSLLDQQVYDKSVNERFPVYSSPVEILEDSLGDARQIEQTKLKSQMRNDSHGKSIYSSLLKILHNMKHQIDTNRRSQPIERNDESSHEDNINKLLQINEPLSQLEMDSSKETFNIAKFSPNRTNMKHEPSSTTIKPTVELVSTVDVVSEPFTLPANVNLVGDQRPAESKVDLNKQSRLNLRASTTPRPKDPNSSEDYKTVELFTRTGTKRNPSPINRMSLKTTKSPRRTDKSLFSLSSQAKQKQPDATSDQATDEQVSLFSDDDSTGTRKHLRLDRLRKLTTDESDDYEEDYHSAGVALNDHQNYGPRQSQMRSPIAQNTVSIGQTSKTFVPYKKAYDTIDKVNEDISTNGIGEIKDNEVSRVQNGESYESYNGNRVPKLNPSSIHLQQVYMPSSSSDIVNSQRRQRQTFATVSGSVPQGGYLNNIPSAASQAPSSTINDGGSYYNSANNQARDLQNQPQTIQITAVPNVGVNGNNPIIRLNGGLGFNNILGNGYLDPFGRQVVMVNAERRQVDWSFWVWPLLAVATLPLVLGALFVPVFLKTIVIIIQILQSLGLLLPITAALSQQMIQSSVSSTNNQLEHTKSS